jgi:hypothetical protein
MNSLSSKKKGVHAFQNLSLTKNLANKIWIMSQKIIPFEYESDNVDFV